MWCIFEFATTNTKPDQKTKISYDHQDFLFSSVFACSKAVSKAINAMCLLFEYCCQFLLFFKIQFLCGFKKMLFFCCLRRCGRYSVAYKNVSKLWICFLFPPSPAMRAPPGTGTNLMTRKSGAWPAIEEVTWVPDIRSVQNPYFLFMDSDFRWFVSFPVSILKGSLSGMPRRTEERDVRRGVH